MAIIWFDGPDHYGDVTTLLLEGVYAEALSSNGNLLVENAGPGGVGTVFRLLGAGILRWVLPDVRDSAGVAYRARFATLPPVNNETFLIEWRDVLNNIVAHLRLISTGAIEYYVGAAMVWRSAPVIFAGSWQHIEAVVGVGAAQRFGLSIDSIAVIDSTGLAVPTEQIAQVAVRKAGIEAMYFRDFYVWDNTGPLNNSGFQGDREVLTEYAIADGAATGWVPSTGVSGWPLISNVPPDDAEFISANVAALVSSFEMGDIDTDITSISAVRLAARIKKSDAGLATVALGVISGVSEEDGAEQAVSTTFRYFSSIFETDPATGVKWTPLGINDMEVKITRVE